MNFSGSANIALNFWTAVMFLVPLMVSVEPILGICAFLLFGCLLPGMLGVLLIQNNKW
jgi:hypothetical protein